MSSVEGLLLIMRYGITIVFPFVTKCDTVKVVILIFQAFAQFQSLEHHFNSFNE